LKVQVLMSTYNGERYIKEQIESILEQTGVEVSLLIRDDGSKDSTRSILDEIQSSDDRVNCVFEENVGVKKSFLKLVKMADPDSDYYAFSDQDDIWLTDKLETAVNVLQKEDADIPLIYGSSVSVYKDETLAGEIFVCPQLNIGNFLIKNYYPGCTMVFNKKTKELIDFVDYNILRTNPLHDHWLNLVCTACGGKVLMDPNPHMLYRLHGNNEVGDRSLLQKIKGNGLFSHSENTRYRICEELHTLYGEKESKEAEALIRVVLDSRKGFAQRVKLACNKSIKPLGITERISIFLIALLGKF